MRKIKIDKKIANEPVRHVPFVRNDKIKIDSFKENCCPDEGVKKWNYFYGFVGLFTIFTVLFGSLINLQVIEADNLKKRSTDNRLRTVREQPSRGIIYDRNGVKLAQNVPVNSILLDLEEFLCTGDSISCTENDEFDLGKLKNVCETFQSINETYVLDSINSAHMGGQQYYSLYDKLLAEISQNDGAKSVLVMQDATNRFAIDIIANSEKLPGFFVQERSKREYTFGEPFGHLLGYVGKASEVDLERLSYAVRNDFVGKAGIERQYDQILVGRAGEVVIEVDSMGRTVGNGKIVKQETVNGQGLYLTIDSNWQKIAYEALSKGVESSGGDAGALIVQNVHNGEIIVMASYPNYDNNKFIGGISSDEYTKLVEDPRKIFLNRAVSGQQSPGSVFKTLVLGSALDSGVIKQNTRFVSSNNYRLASNTYFYEFNRVSHGSIDLKRAIAVSSNIYPCETIRNWDIDELVSYLEEFEVGKKTGIDLPGEEKGMMPSPEQKKWLAQNGFYWLDERWYEPADSCYTVIGQGIVMVTPIQVVNWASLFANGGTLHTPHIAMATVDTGGEFNYLEFEPRREQVISTDAVNAIKESMRAVVTEGSSYSLRDAKYPMAVKTGTSEAGKRLESGGYESSHSWVMGFFPYDDPEYAVTVHIEFGGRSYNAQEVLKDFINQL